VKVYDIFRRDGPGLAPTWMRGEDNLEVAKLEAMRLAAKSSKRHFVIDLSTLTVMYRELDVRLSEVFRCGFQITICSPSFPLRQRAGSVVCCPRRVFGHEADLASQLSLSLPPIDHAATITTKMSTTLPTTCRKTSMHEGKRCALMQGI
jgi:hypothetical protein